MRSLPRQLSSGPLDDHGGKASPDGVVSFKAGERQKAVIGKNHQAFGRPGIGKYHRHPGFFRRDDEWAKSGLVNILGGCCGTTPDHIHHVADAVAGLPARQVPERPVAMRLAGLEPFELA